jgi:hypothetical protein
MVLEKVHAYLNKGIFYDYVLLVGSTKAADDFLQAVKILLLRVQMPLDILMNMKRYP